MVNNLLDLIYNDLNSFRSLIIYDERFTMEYFNSTPEYYWSMSQDSLALRMQAKLIFRYTV